MSFLKSTYNLLVNALQKDKPEDTQILEPLTTIINLAIISFKNIGTKISISQNKIYIQPSNMIQGALRWTYGTKRDEVHYLLKPIFRSLQIYNPVNNPNLRCIFEQAVLGLKLLKESYNNNSSIVCHALDLYINIIENSLKNEDYSIEPFIETSVKDNLNLSQNTKVNLDNLFKGIWLDAEIVLIASMLRLASQNTTDKKSYIGAIESILTTKEKLVNQIIQDTNKLLS